MNIHRYTHIQQINRYFKKSEANEIASRVQVSRQCEAPA